MKGPVQAHGQWKASGASEQAGKNMYWCWVQLQVSLGDRPGSYHSYHTWGAFARPGGRTEVLYVSLQPCVHGVSARHCPGTVTGWFAGEQCSCRKTTLMVTHFCCPRLPLRLVEKAEGEVLFCSIFSLNSRKKVDVVNAATHFATGAFLCGWQGLCLNVRQEATDMWS